MARTVRVVGNPTGLVLPRARAHPVLVAAAFVTVLLSVVGMTALLAFGHSVAEQGLTRLLTADPARAAIGVSGALAGPDGTAQDEAVRSAAARELAAVPTTTASAAQSLPYRLPAGTGAPGGLTTFWALEDLQQHAHLTAGEWARPTSTGPVEVVVSSAAAGLLALQPGSRLRLTSATFGPPVEALVRGVYEPDDPADPRWSLDPLAGAGASVGEYRTYGPLTVPAATLLGRLAASARLSWVVQPDLSGVTAEDLATLQDQVDRFHRAVTTEPAFRSGSQVVTGLPTLLGQASRAVVVSRSTTPVPQLLLGALAGYAIWYVGWLMHGQRRDERSLLRARGASRGQHARAALVEAVGLVLPAVVLAPLLAGWSLRWAAGPLGLTAARVQPPDPMTATGWPALVLVAVGAVLALAAPALLQRDPSARPGRSRRRTGLQRAGADLALLVLAALAYLQLRSVGSPFTSADVRSLRVDPVYVAGPVLLLAASALLGLRVLPLLASAVERLAARSASATPALGVWPVSRRPLRHAGPLLLLVVALSVGLLAAVSAATGERSRVDQADFAVGADVRLTVPAGRTLDGPATRELLAGIPGVVAVMPVRSELVDTGSGSGATTTLVALDSTVAPGVVLLRPDLAGDLASTTYASLRPDRGSALPAVATTGLLQARDVAVGDTVNTTVRGVTLPVRIVATVQQFPTVSSGEGLVVDLATLQRQLAASGHDAGPSQWWLRAPEPTADQVVAAIGQRAGPGAEVVDRYSVRDALQEDPLALGFQSSLRIALVAGMLFAATGFGVSILLAAQERHGELALLRALGMRRRAVAATVWLEQGLVLGLGVVLGLAVGLVVSTLIVPLTTVSSRTGAVVPPAITTVPVAQTCALVAALLAILGLTLAVVTRAARRGRVESALHVEDRS